MCFMLKPEVALIELEHDSNDIMYSSIIKKILIVLTNMSFCH